MKKIIVCLLVLLASPLYAQETPIFEHTWTEGDGPVAIPATDIDYFGQTTGRIEINFTPRLLHTIGDSMRMVDIPNHLGIWVWNDGVHGHWYTTDPREERVYRARWGLVQDGVETKIVVTWDADGYAVIVDGVVRIHDWQAIPESVYPNPRVVSGTYGAKADGTYPVLGDFTLKMFDVPLAYNPCLVDVVGTVNENVPLDNTGSWSVGIDPRCSGAPTSSVELTWIAPTENDDGTPLLDLAGYKIYYGTSSGSYTSIDTVADPSALSHTVSGLVAGDWYFTATAYNLSDVESVYAVEVMKTALPTVVPNPPTGLTVQDLVVYTVTKIENQFRLVVVGSVPVGTACDPTQSVNGHNAVPIDAVQWTGTVRDRVVVAKCS